MLTGHRLQKVPHYSSPAVGRTGDDLAAGVPEPAALTAGHHVAFTVAAALPAAAFHP